MTKDQAEQIASLLNRRNQLTRVYTATDVLQSAKEYEFISAEDGKILGCVQVRKVQWYQAELCHLTLDECGEGKGYASQLIEKAETRARGERKSIVQCTIRVDNEKSMTRFRKSGYEEVGRFHNATSGNDIAVFQKVLAPVRHLTVLVNSCRTVL